MRRVFQRLVLSLAGFTLALAAGVSASQAACSGTNLIETLQAEEAARLDRAVAAQPFPAGNLWRATRDGAEITLLGTYHFADPRHAAIIDRVRPLIADARHLLVEAGPEEERQLMEAMARNPELMYLTEGGSLLERMAPDDWEALSSAMAARGIPGFMAAKLQPWYVAMMLAIPPCDAEAMQNPNGLDKLVRDVAEKNGLRISALEPFDTIFRLFDSMSTEDQIAMITATLALEDKGLAESLSVTLADLYFAQDARRMWEYMRLISQDLPGYTAESADAEYARMEEIMMAARNRAWIPLIESAASEGPVFVAFGALHLAGQDGVLALLERAGFTLERLDL
jgi:uncharacterized protein